MVVETDGAVFCPYHLRLAEEHGVEAVTNGALPKKRAMRVVHTEAAEEPVSNKTGLTAVSVDPATVRPSLAAAAAENVEQLKASLLEAAGSAVKPVWLTVECSGCGERSRVEAPVPDVRARVAAIELLLREGLGRVPQAEEPTSARLPATAAAVSTMAWPELQLLASTIVADEIVAVMNGGGRELLRERLAPLSDDERCVLREELAAVSA
jgi:hypothetical protein